MAKGQDYGRIDSLQNLLTGNRKVENRVNLLLNISHEFEISQADSALGYARLAYAVSQEEDYSRGIVLALVQEGRMLMQKNDFSSALDIFEEAIQLGNKYKMANELGIANGVTAIIYAELGDYDNSAKYNFRALEFFEKAGNKKEIGVTLGNIAADMLSQKNHRKALDYMNQALNIAIGIKDKPGIAQQYNNIAGVYFSSFSDYGKALTYYRKSSRVNREIGDNLQLGINQLNIGFCYLRMNEPDSALPYFIYALERFRESDNPVRIANGELALAKYYQATGNLEKSLEHAGVALKISSDNRSKEIISESSEIIFKILLANKDTLNAFRYAEIHYKSKDSLLQMQSQKTLFKLEYQYNYEKKDKERKLKQQRSNYILGFIILGLFSGIIIVLLIYSRQRIKIRNADLEKQKISDELNFKNKELTINLMALMKKNELLTDISQKLIKIEKEVPKDELQTAINKLNKDLKQTSDEKIWKEFALRFNQTNSDFYEKLLKKYPDLTQNELRLCAYLRLNMTSKEISEITGQRILTLEHARYRLRKKLGISGSDNNLTSFLAQI
ncbi:MAG: tetratricopeptide repeat protein [Bacteroidota bacterium]